jgi:hypothetical protein
MRIVVVLVGLALLAGSLSATNILLNSSFENWLFGMPVAWLSSELLYPGSAVQDSNSNTGTYCVKLAGGDTAAFVSTASIVTAGRSYEFSGYARVPGVLGGSFVLVFLNSQGDTVGSPELLPVYYSGAEYREYTRWVTAPESAVGVLVSFATLAGLEAYVDDVTLDDTTSPGGIVESPVYLSAGFRPRKILSIPGSSNPAAVPTILFDPLGRRVAKTARSGVYFAIPER